MNQDSKIKKKKSEIIEFTYILQLIVTDYLFGVCDRSDGIDQD